MCLSPLVKSLKCHANELDPYSGGNVKLTVAEQGTDVDLES